MVVNQAVDAEARAALEAPCLRGKVTFAILMVINHYITKKMSRETPRQKSLIYSLIIIMEVERKASLTKL